MFALQEFPLNPHHSRTVLDMDHNLTVNLCILRISTLRAAEDFAPPNAFPRGWCSPCALLLPLVVSTVEVQAETGEGSPPLSKSLSPY